MTWLYIWLAACIPVSLFTAAFMRAGKGPVTINIEEQSTCKPHQKTTSSTYTLAE